MKTAQKLFRSEVNPCKFDDSHSTQSIAGVL